jgi:hypothetical protein
VRNTWGRFEWKGDWGDDSKKWDEHPEMKAATKWSKKEDGIFWVTPDDYYKHWGGGFRCARLDGVTPTGQGATLRQTMKALKKALPHYSCYG